MQNINNSHREFILKENHTLDTLQVVSDPMLLSNITNPFTKQPYDGMLLMGEFASMDVLNNNNRYYTEKNYLPFIEQLKKQIFEPRGLYGELEHPKSYATSGKNLSHKIVDIWYDNVKKKVFGIILVLNTPDGLKIQEVYKSGGQLGVSARAGGTENKNADGTLTSEIRMIISFDVVYHPGFTTAIADQIIDINSLKNIDGYTSMNESQIFGRINNVSEIFSHKVYKDGTVEENSRLFESDSFQQKEDISKLQTGETKDKNQIENDLGNAVDKELKESEVTPKITKQQQLQLDFVNNLKDSEEELKKRMTGGLYDNSSGFLTEGLSGVSNPGQLGLINQNKKYNLKKIRN